MRYLISAFVSLLILFPGAAYAESLSTTVSANRTSPIGGFSIYDKANCRHGGKVDYRVKKKPEHGKVSVQFHKTKLGKGAGKCAGRQASGMVVLYTPNRGYRGKDKVTVTFIYDKYVGGHASHRNAKTYQYKVTVK